MKIDLSPDTLDSFGHNALGTTDVDVSFVMKNAKVSKSVPIPAV